MLAAVALATLALGITATFADRPSVLAPALDRGSLLPELGNAIREHDVVQLATPADAELVQTAFLAGSWPAFGTWAQLVIAGRVSRPASDDGTPHARFWTMVIARPAAERDAFLRFVVRARELHRGVLDKLGTPALPSCSAECRKLLLAYFGAFTAPRHTADPAKPMGEHVVAYSMYPDEAMIGLAGDLGLDGAVADLERFVAAERRFYQLFTDYSTHPEEVGGVFDASLRALVKLARANAALAPSIRRFLDAEAARSDEKAWFESYYDARSGSNIDVQERSVTAPVAKRPSLATAIAAIGGDRAALATLSARIALFPTARWIDRIDVHSAAERRGGKLWLQRGRLLVLDQTSLIGIDVATGDHVFQSHLEAMAGAGGIQAGGQTFIATPAGLISPIWVRDPRGKIDDELRLCTFDPATGAVTNAPVVHAKLPANASIDYLAAAGGAVWLQLARTVLRLALDGRVLEARTLAVGETVRVGGDKLAHFTTTKITIEGPGGHVLLDRDVASLVGGGDKPVSGIELRKDDFLIYVESSTVYAVDYTGTLRWKAELTDPWRDRGPETCDGDHLCVRTDKDFYVFAADGKRIAKLAVPAGTIEVAVATGRMYVQTDDAMIARPLAGGAPVTIVDKLTGMARIAGVTDDCVLVSVYASGQRAGDATGYHLACFPIPAAIK